MDYVLANNTYLVTPKDDWKDRISLEIGDSKEPDIVLPQQKIMRWDNECNVSIRLKDFDEYSVYQDKDKVIFGNETKEVHIYPITEGEGGQEFEIILKEKPKTNVIQFSLVDKGVEYFYQPALTQQEIDEGAIRPENVIGSYAVYAKTPKTNWTGGKEYKCGKIGHIYRPKIIDSAGTEVWGDLHIENGILSVTIPQDFLDKAVYPIRHAAGLEFGYHTNGGSTIGLSNNIASFSPIAIDGGTATLLSIYATGIGNVQLAIYDDTSPSNKEVATGNIAVNGLNWYNSSALSTALGADSYFLCVNSSASSMIRCDQVSGNVYYYKSLTFNTWPDTITWGTSGTYKLSIYCTYTAEGGTTYISSKRTLLGVGT